MIRLENVLRTSLQEVLKTSWQDVLKMSWRLFLRDLLKTSWKRLEDVMARLLEDVLKKSWRRLEDAWPRRIYWSWSRPLEDLFWRRMTKANIFVLIKTSWRHFLKTINVSRRLQDVFIECLLGRNLKLQLE